jgi:hypothetical protein
LARPPTTAAGKRRALGDQVQPGAKILIFIEQVDRRMGQHRPQYHQQQLQPVH